VVTDQTAAHDLLYGYVPQGYSPADVRRERERDPAKLTADGVRSIGVHVQAMLELQKLGAIVFDNGNLIRSQAIRAGVTRAFDIPVFTEAFLRPLFCGGSVLSDGSRYPETVRTSARSTITCCRLSPMTRR